MEHASMTSIKMANGCVVRVGDTMPLVTAPGKVTQIDPDGRLWVDGWLYSPKGVPYNARQQDIDLAKLAEQQAAATTVTGDLATTDDIEWARSLDEYAPYLHDRLTPDDWKRFNRLVRSAAALATAQPAGAPLREMVERWKRRTDSIQRAIDAGAYTAEGRQVMESCIEAINTCAAELSAALPGGMTEGQVERAAIAIAEVQAPEHAWVDFGEYGQEDYRKLARAAIAALSEPPR